MCCVFHFVRATRSCPVTYFESITAIANVIHIPCFRTTTAQALDAHEKYPPSAGGEYMSPAYYCGDNIMAILRSLPGGPDYSGARAARAARRRRDRRRRRESANKGGESGSEHKTSAHGAASGSGDAPTGLRRSLCAPVRAVTPWFGHQFRTGKQRSYHLPRQARDERKENSSSRQRGVLMCVSTHRIARAALARHKRRGVHSQ